METKPKTGKNLVRITLELRDGPEPLETLERKLLATITEHGIQEYSLRTERIE